MKTRCQFRIVRLLVTCVVFFSINLSVTSQIALAFSGTPTITGTAGAVGAKYTYANIGTTGGITIKGVIEIIAIDGAGLDNIDGPVSTGGTDNAFQPVIYGSKTSGNCWSIQFRISFFDAANNAPLVLSTIRANGVDIDGNNGTLREHNTFFAPYSYTLNNPTNLTFTNNAGQYQFLAPTTSYAGIALTQTNVAVTCVYNNSSSIDISIGSCCIGGNCSVGAGSGRQHSINFFDAIPYSNPIVLPMTLSSFTARSKEGAVMLEWVTVEEIRLARFILEKSTDVVNYSDEAVINAKGTAYTYTYLDSKPSDNKKYYRLRCEDIDGKIMYSSVVHAEPFNSKSSQLTTSAAATTEGFNLFIRSNSGQRVDICMVDSYGNAIGRFKNDIRKGNNIVPLTNGRILRKGIYFISITSSTGRQVIKVIR